MINFIVTMTVAAITVIFMNLIVVISYQGALLLFMGNIAGYISCAVSK